MHKNLPVTLIEHRVPEQAVLLSKTNLLGQITYCNRAFCEISGYGEAELLGHAHNIVRHPDVPAAYFADCWACLKADRPWHGVIKNRCKNGDYYWVEANITPWLEDGEKIGYVSLRYRATAEQVVIAQQAYCAVAQGAAVQVYSPQHNLYYIVELQQRLADKIMKLEKHRDRGEEELQIGSEIVSRIHGMHGMTDASVRQKITPAAYCSGDVILATRTPEDVLHVLLADAVGHGLIAAINVLPLSQAFYSMSKKGFGIAPIAEELNQKIHTFMPVDRFVATTLVAIDARRRRIEVWNGGNPAALLVSDSGDMLQRWPSRNLPLGILNREHFSSETEVFEYKENGQLFIYSDGLPEAESASGEPFGRQRLEASLLNSAAALRFDQLMAQFEGHLAGQAAHDDVSLAMVSVACNRTEPLSVTSTPDTQCDEGWRFVLRLGAAELRVVEFVPLISHIVRKVQLELQHQSALFVILTELFNNALDHGVLGMDSALKQGENGFERYLQLRAERLAALSHGHIEFELEKIRVEDQNGIKIRLEDSGAGFAYQEEPSNSHSLAPLAQHGRGMALVRKLAHQVSYGQYGNEVRVLYLCP